MSPAHRDRLVRLAAVISVCLSLLLAGCGTPGAPQPPSLNLPARVSNLSATRVGNHVSLAWTMPKRNTDKLLLKGNIAAIVCRQQVAQASSTLCETAGELQLAPAAEGAFSETLPAALVPRPVSDIEEGFISASSCILANDSLKLGRTIEWDAKARRVVADEEANKLLARPYRGPWVHPGA